ncbi:hypothetical protein BH11ACT5_BH11ACT5_06450 [soil metagenome]
MIRRALVLAPLLAAVLALAACHPTIAASTSPPPVVPTKTVSATPTPTPTPTPTAEPKAVLASIYVDGDAMTLTATDGTVIASLDYFQPQDAAVATLTDALGFAPAPDSSNSSPAFDFEGFKIVGPPIDGGPGWTYRVSTTVASVRGIPITTVGGAGVGSDAQSLVAAYPSTSRMITTWQLIGIPSGSYGAVLRAENPSGAVTSMLVPAPV